MSDRISYFPLEGGEDLISPAGSANPGMLRFSRNYECDPQGKYRRIDGYERYDGRPRPSEASYWMLGFVDGSTELTGIIEGETSGATGEVLDLDVNLGAWATSDAAGEAVLFNVTGLFLDGENLLVGDVVSAEADGATEIRGASNDTDDKTYLRAAIEATRDDIGAVPGSGSILGVFQYDGDVYAVRNNTLGTAAVMYRATTSGWTICDLGETISFDRGTSAFEVGDTVTQGTTIAEVARVVLTGGAWDDGDAEGYITVIDREGMAFSPGRISVGGQEGVASATSYSVSNTFLPSGRFEFVQHNFYGHANSRRMYGCDGVNKAFEYDGSALTFITTGMTTDTPNHIHVHRNHLFLSFSGGSLQHSSIGDPMVWTALTGAAEFGIGDEIMGMLSMPNVMAVWSRNSTRLLYGTSVDDWNLQTHSDESGAIEWSLQKIGNGIYLDDRGLTSLGAVQEYGDFHANVISRLVQPWLKTKKSLVQSSLRIREKNQYRLFFSDKEVLTLTLNGSEIVGFTRQYYDHLPVCCCSSEDENGFEELYFGSTDGYIYQLDKGTSFDGGAITSILSTHFNSLKTPANKKRFRKLDLELVSPSGTDISVLPDISYGAEDNQASSETFEIFAQGGAWDIGEWESFIWDGPFVGTAEARIDGSGTNIAIVLVSESTYDEPHIIQGLTVHYDIRGIRR